MKSRSKHEGGVLVLVLLILALILSIGVQSVDRIHFNFNQAVKDSKDNQSYWYALGLESAVTNFLENKSKEEDSFKPLMLDIKIPFMKFSMKKAVIEGSLDDLSACFNLNSLVRSDGKEGRLVVNNQGLILYRNLLLSLEIDRFLLEDLIYGLLDWIDSDNSSINTYGAEDDFYTRLDSPYWSANQLLSNKSELANIKNYSTEIVKKILPYVCVLPESATSSININTIPKNKPEILMMLFGENLPRESALQVLDDRPLEGYLSIEEFISHPELGRLILSGYVRSYLKMSSNYYLLNSKVIYNDHVFTMNSSLKLLDSGKVKVFKRELVF